MNIPKRPLIEFADLASGGTPSKSRSDYWGGSIPWLTPKDMANFNGETEDSVQETALGNGTRLAPENCLFIAVRGMSLHNEIRIVRPRKEMAFNQDIKAVIPRENVDSAFLYYALLNEVPKLLGAVHAAGHGTGVLSTDLLKQTRLADFEPDYRCLIGRKLAEIDDKIELNRRMNKTLDALARAVFRDWFVDFGPTRRKAAGEIDPVAILGGLLPDSIEAAPLAALFPNSFGDNGLPEGWEARALASVVEQHKQTVKPDQHPEETFEHFSLPAFDKERWPSLATGTEIKSNKTSVPSGALLVSKLNPRIERTWVPQVALDHRQICSTEFLCFKPIGGFGLATIEALFRSKGMRDTMASMVTGTSNSHQRVPPKVLMQAEVLLPEHIASAFEGIALPLLKMRQSNQQENQTLAATRDLLLPKLMSGDIRLKNVGSVT